MTQVPFRFAFRYWEIEPEVAVWPDTHWEGYPSPPREWRPKEDGFSIPWHGFAATNQEGTRIQRLQAHYVLRLMDTTSIAWCQESQSFWVAPRDLSNPTVRAERTADNWRDWSFLYFSAEDRNNAFDPITHRIFGYGFERQLDCACPDGFDEFLPQNKFRGAHADGQSQCHLVGKLSLILALHAMCPENADNIPEQIARVFWREQKPAFTPTSVHGMWQPRDKFAKPARALIMQTAVYAHMNADDAVVDAQEKVLRDWEKGVYGPLVSS